MNRIKEIVLSYAAAFNPTQTQKSLAEERLMVCLDCKYNDSVQCTKCGCYISKKIFSPRGAAACPEGKWQR